MFEIAGQKRRDIGAEVLGNDEQGVSLARFKLLHALFARHERPSELIVLLQLRNHVVAELKVPQRIVMRTRVFVDDAHAKIARVLVGIPETQDVEPRVKGGKHDQEQDDEPRLRHFGYALHIAPEHTKDVSHDASS